MSNRVYIDTFEKVNFRNREVYHIMEISDDYDSASIIVPKEIIDCDDFDILRNLIKEKNKFDYHGRDCDKIEQMLDFIENSEQGIFICGNYYEHKDIEDVLKLDWREVYYCKKCGWESYDDIDFDNECPQNNCDGIVSGITEEWCQLPPP